MKITDLLVSILLKKSVLCETKNIDMEMDIPASMVNANAVDPNAKITIRIKAENVKVTVEKE